MGFPKRTNWMKAESMGSQALVGGRAKTGDQCRSIRPAQWRSIDTRISKRADGLSGPSIADDHREQEGETDATSWERRRGHQEWAKGGGGRGIKERRAREMLACEKACDTPAKSYAVIFWPPAISRRGTNVRRAKHFRIALGSTSHPWLSCS
jgi:hypothetical protein